MQYTSPANRKICLGGTKPKTGSQNLVSEYKNSIKDIGIHGASHYGGYPGGNSS
jgi:hypothetical protein